VSAAHRARLDRCRWRSALFGPANNPALVPKLPRSGPDVVILDLEDAVPPAEKPAARTHMADGVVALTALAHGPLVAVRVNAVRTPWFVDDVRAAMGAGADVLVLPKAERLDDLDALRTVMAGTDAPYVPAVLAGIETALGVADARAFLGHGVVACYFGAEDFVTDMGGVRTETNAEVVHARAHVALVARVCGVAALDIVTADLGDAGRFRREAAEARALGYAGKLCIHPSQVPLAHESFAPSAAEIDRARRVLAAWAEANERGVGAIAFEGQLVDEPMAARARAVLAAAGAQGGPDTGP
jgi:citrate lyase subunit beta/citryl-CoA lyase